MTDTTTTTTTDVQSEPETVASPAAGTVGIRLPSGEICNPIFVSVKSLVRMGQGEFDAILGWVLSERKRAAAQQAEREAEQAERAAEIRRDAEARHAAFEQMRREEPWRLA